MLFIENKISNEELESITNFFESFEDDMTNVTSDNSVAKYNTSLLFLQAYTLSLLKISLTQKSATKLLKKETYNKL